MKEQNNKSSGVPVWERYVLTIVEAANYYHIGEAKIRKIVEEHEDKDLAITNGNRVLIKKKQFEMFLDESTTL